MRNKEGKLRLVKKLSQPETEKLLNKLRVSMSCKFLTEFKVAFSSESECKNINKYIALPPDKRTYYLVYHKGRAEALFGIDFTIRTNWGIKFHTIPSFARIIEKDQDAAEGWWYLKEMIEQRLRSRCRRERVKIISARLKTKGGKKVFNELFCELKKRTPVDYTIVVEGDSGRIETKM